MRNKVFCFCIALLISLQLLGSKADEAKQILSDCLNGQEKTNKVESYKKLIREYGDEQVKISNFSHELNIGSTAMLLLAEEYFNNGQFDEALKTYKDIKERYGDVKICNAVEGGGYFGGNGKAVALLGIESVAGKKNDIKTVKEILLEIVGEFSGVRFEPYEGTGDFDVIAMSVLRKMTARGDADYSESLEVYNKIITGSKSEHCRAEAYFAKYEAYRKGKDIKKSLEVLEEVKLKCSKYYFVSYLDSGNIYLLDGLLAQAEIYLFELKNKERAEEIVLEYKSGLREFSKIKVLEETEINSLYRRKISEFETKLDTQK